MPTLVLGSNRISDVSSLSNLTELTYLNLQVNEIKVVTPLTTLTNLKELHIYSNQISDITSLQILNNLTHLNLAANAISDISALSKLTKLEWIDLAVNQIVDLSPLVENEGISGKIIISPSPSETNPLNNLAYSTHIPALQARGIDVRYIVPEDVVLFKDANLEKAIRDALGIPTELLKKEDLEKLKELKYDGSKLAENKRIADLTGIENCTSLTSLFLHYNRQITVSLKH